MAKGFVSQERENIEQGAYADGVTVSKPGIGRDWRRILLLGRISPVPEGSGDADQTALLQGSETDRIIFQSLLAHGGCADSLFTHLSMKTALFFLSIKNKPSHSKKVIQHMKV